MKNVYLSKPGVLCAAGSTAEELWASVISGNQAGIKKVKALNGKEFFAGRVEDTLLLEKSTSRYDMRIMRIEEKCLSQLNSEIAYAKEIYSPSRIAVCVGSCDNGTEFSVAGHRKFFANGKFDSDYSLEIQGADYVSTFVAEKYGLEGPCMTFSTACSSSAGAIIKAAELIRSGLCDAVVAGGVDIASDTVLMGFDALEAVSSEVTNPFSKNRHGITLGEAAAFFVITKEDLFNTKVQLSGFGESADAYHMTSPDPSGDGARRAMENALSSSGLKPSEIGYINLHGTGTRFNDSMESKAVEAVFGSLEGEKVPVSTTKPLTGHTLGAAGALEAAVCFMVLKNSSEKSALPVQIWDGERDPELPYLNFVGKENSVVQKKIKACMSNSFAFGGSNASLVFSKN